MLSAVCNEMSDWPSKLWQVQQSLNTTIQKSTGFSPLRLLIGRESNLPFIQARLDEITSDDTPDLIDVRADRCVAQQRLKDTAETFKKRFVSTRRNNFTVNIGDTALTK